MPGGWGSAKLPMHLPRDVLEAVGIGEDETSLQEGLHRVTVRSQSPLFVACERRLQC